MRYFPLVSRLHRLFVAEKSFANIRWHRDKRVKTNNVLKQTTDAEGSKHFDSAFPNFSSYPWNVPLGLALDGFNSFGYTRTSYSMSPVVKIPYNLQPRKCMKEKNLFMSLLISGPRSLSREIDMYLQPLIEELKELWNFSVRMTLLSISSFSYMQLYCGRLITFQRMVTYQGEVWRGIRHVPYAWVIDHISGYEVKYPWWDIDAIF